jgi:2-dehydropantoate 2-reductase
VVSRILIYGAGVIGTVYAAKLSSARHSVTMLARGRRLSDICAHGLELEDVVLQDRATINVGVTERLAPDDAYDLVLVAVRRDQIAECVPELAANRRVPTFLFMLNNPLGSDDLLRALGGDRMLLGFPGVGGTRAGNLVKYAMVDQQPTTVGEIDGRRTRRLDDVVSLFRRAGIPTAISSDMDAWLKTHAFFVTAICGAIYLAGGDCRQLSNDTATLRLMVKGVREGFACVRALGRPVTPFPLRVLFNWLPQVAAVTYWRLFMARPAADYVFGRHARAASGEIRALAGDCRTILALTGAKAKALTRLYSAIDDFAVRAL